MKVKVKGPQHLNIAIYWETQTAAVYNAKWCTGRY